MLRVGGKLLVNSRDEIGRGSDCFSHCYGCIAPASGMFQGPACFCLIQPCDTLRSHLGCDGSFTGDGALPVAVPGLQLLCQSPSYATEQLVHCCLVAQGLSPALRNVLGACECLVS